MLKRLLAFLGTLACLVVLALPRSVSACPS
jgi:hypothetical protein